MKSKRKEESPEYRVTSLGNGIIELECEFGIFKLRAYTDVDPDETGVSVNTKGGKFRFQLPNLTLDITDTDSMNKIIEQIGEQENS